MVSAVFFAVASIFSTIFASSYALAPPKPLVNPLVHQAAVPNPLFRDVASESGLTQLRARKFGGPHVSDLNGDGIYDVVFSVHNRGPVEVFFGNGDGSFSKGNFRRNTDVHGISSAPRTVNEATKLFTISYGGGRGSNLTVPGIIQVGRDRTMTDVSFDYGFGKLGGRGRNVIFMDLSLEGQTTKRQNLGGYDVVFMNYLGDTNDPRLFQFAYKNVRGNFELKPIPGLARELRARCEVTDIDGDGRMEIVSIREGKLYKLVAPFQFADVSNQVWNPSERIVPFTGAAAADLDFDGDGDFDLYIATADLSVVTNRPPGGRQSDRLYENRNGRYVDVSAEAGIPTGTNSVGVTTGDFNNDGFTDLLVALHDQPDMLLLNQGDGTFQRVDNTIPKASDTVSDNAVAVDYNLDGRLDAFVGHGGQEGPAGFFKLMRNTMPLTGANNYLLVRVGNSPARGAIAMHTKVTVSDGSFMTTRRVGSPGAQNGGQCYLDTVHIGVGARQRVDLAVEWTDGTRRQVFRVPTNGKINIGYFPPV